MPMFSTEGLTGPVWYYNDDHTDGDIRVDGDPMVAWAVAARIVVPCQAGDKMRVAAELRVTNDIGPTVYTVGVGLRLAWYRYEAGPATITLFSKSSGTNVDRRVVHHGMLSMARYWEAPADWPAGHRVVFRLYADASSTAWQANAGADEVTIDDMGHIDVMRWSLPQAA